MFAENNSEYIFIPYAAIKLIQGLGKKHLGSILTLLQREDTLMASMICLMSPNTQLTSKPLYHLRLRQKLLPIAHDMWY